MADQSVDVIISNCVIKLSPKKPQVFRKAFRVRNPAAGFSEIRITPKDSRELLQTWGTDTALNA